jgi:predicted Fe-Mo cluster-binding NifX family protein
MVIYYDSMTKERESDMKLAFTSKGITWDSMMDPRFGRTEYILVYDDANDKFSHFENSAIKNEVHGAGPRTAQKVFDLQPDVLITGNGPGGNAAAVLKKMNMKIYIGAGEMSVKEAYNAYKKGILNEQEL